MRHVSSALDAQHSSHRFILPESNAEYQRARRQVDKGLLEQLDRGLYARTDQPPSAFDALVSISLRDPKLIIWGTSALEYHGLTTSSPTLAFVGVEPHGWSPTSWAWPPLACNHVHKPEIGVETYDVAGVPVRMTTPVRSIVDAFRRDDCMPLDIAIESLRMGFEQQVVDAPQLMDMAHHLGCAARLQPYVAALCA